MKIITVPNLDRYQHYRDRHIIWIKLYVDIIQDYKFNQLEDNERWIFIGLILLAVKNDNRIPADLQFIGKEISFSSKSISRIILKLCDLKLITIKTIARCYPNATIDKIREDKKRKEDIFSPSNETGERNTEGLKKLRELKDKLLYKK